LLAGFDQRGGWLAGVDVASDKHLWVLQVYDNRRDPALEGDVQDVFLRTRIGRNDRTRLIENERRGRFVVDPALRTVKPAP
jgi:hypothetical protein